MKRTNGIRNVAIFHFLISAIIFISGIVYFFKYVNLDTSSWAFAFHPLIVLVVPIIFAFSHFFIGRGIWRGNNWVKTLLIIFGIFYLLGGYIGAFPAQVLLIIQMGTILYLFFNKKAKSYFKKKI